MTKLTFYICTFLFITHCIANTNCIAPLSKVGDAKLYLQQITSDNKNDDFILVAQLKNKAYNLQEDLKYLGNVIDLLNKGSSLDSVNRKIIPLFIKKQKELLQTLQNITADSLNKNLTKQLLQEWINLRNWFFFLLSSQDYKSPAEKRDNTVFQGGLLKISKYVKYLRSEVNTPNFGEKYQRNTVLIQDGSKESFVDISAKYISLTKRNNSITFKGDLKNLTSFLMENNNSQVFIEIERDKEFQKLYAQVKTILLQTDFTGTLYIRYRGKVNDNLKSDFLELLNGKNDLNLLIEEDYDPFELNIRDFRKITLIHNNQDSLRYQLLQDAASMGYRPALEDVARYYYAANKLEDILNLEYKTEDDIIANNSDTSINKTDKKERDRDYQVLIDTIEHLMNKITNMKSDSDLNKEIRKRIFNTAYAVRKILYFIMDNDIDSVKQIAQTFHQSYFIIRTLLLYTSRLEILTTDLDSDSVEKEISNSEHGLSLATNSGMTASRAVITLLSESVGEAYSTDHYWETDFLIENLFSHNPHYKQNLDKTPNRLTKIPFNASEEEIEALCKNILDKNTIHKGGQILALDRSIAPFFYTRTFNLFHLCQQLDIESYRIENPLYIVVDNTLDFASVNQATLFPNGIPENVYLIFTASMAKLHQLGMDMVTGGIINLHYNPANNDDAVILYKNLKEKILSENTGQDPYKSALIENVFYQRYKNNTMKNYLDYMVRKRQRNTKILINTLHANIGEYLTVDPSIKGMFHYKNPLNSSDFLSIRDREGIEHKIKFSFHYDPKSCIHGFFQILEENTDKYIAGPVFEEMKRRIFAKAANEGIHLADGTSWGFHITRMDWYMHTMRLATGLEHNKTLARLGRILSSVVKELLLYPDDFLNNVEVENMTPEMIQANKDAIIKLDREIPHDIHNPTSLAYYLKDEAGKWDYSFVIKDHNQIAAMLLAYEKTENDEKTIYISKASTAKEFRGRGFFKRMNLYLKDIAKSKGIKKITLETSASEKNNNVIKAYERCGFEVIATSTEMLENGWPLIKVIMELPTERSDLALIDHFNPVSAETYKEIHDKYV